MRRRNEAAELVSLTLTAQDGSGVEVTPGTGSAFVARKLAAKLVAQVKVVQGQMDSQSFYSSAVAAGLKDALIPDFFQAFVYDFDFQREIAPGDVFEAAFEQHVNDRGEAVGDLDLLYASMVTKAKSRALYRFRPSGATETAWFDGAGITNDGWTYRNSYAWIMAMRNGRLIRVTAFFDGKALDDLWERVRP